MAASGPPTGVFYVPTEGDPFAFDTRLLTEVQPQYVAISSFEWQDLKRIQHMPNLDPIAKLQVDREREFERVLNERYQLEKVFGANGVVIHDLQYVRPVIYLYRRK
jgi:hypothetical protein